MNPVKPCYLYSDSKQNPNHLLFIDSKANSTASNPNTSISNQTLSSLNPDINPSKELTEKIKMNKNMTMNNPFSSSKSVIEISPTKFLNYEEIPINKNYSYSDNSNGSHNETNFCDAFFSVSIPFSNQKITHESTKLSSCCGHSNCEMFNSYKPEIIKRFPEEDSNLFELNSIVI